MNPTASNFANGKMHDFGNNLAKLFGVCMRLVNIKLPLLDTGVAGWLVAGWVLLNCNADTQHPSARL